MRITTLINGTNIYTNLTKHGYIMLQFVSGNDFQNAPRIFLSPEQIEKFITVIDLFLNKKQIINPISIAFNPNGNAISAVTRDEQLMLILTVQNVGNNNIPLSRLQATALRRFLINWPVYGTLHELINSNNRRQGRTTQQGGYNNPSYQQPYPQQNPVNPYQQPVEPPIGSPANPIITQAQNMNTIPQQTNNEPNAQTYNEPNIQQNNPVSHVEQQVNTTQQTNMQQGQNNTMQPQVNSALQQTNNPEDILNELDELIG